MRSGTPLSSERYKPSEGVANTQSGNPWSQPDTTAWLRPNSRRCCHGKKTRDLENTVGLSPSGLPIVHDPLARSRPRSLLTRAHQSYHVVVRGRRHRRAGNDVDDGRHLGRHRGGGGPTRTADILRICSCGGGGGGGGGGGASGAGTRRCGFLLHDGDPGESISNRLPRKLLPGGSASCREPAGNKQPDLLVLRDARQVDSLVLEVEGR